MISRRDLHRVFRQLVDSRCGKCDGAWRLLMQRSRRSGVCHAGSRCAVEESKMDVAGDGVIQGWSMHTPARLVAESLPEIPGKQILTTAAH